MAFIIDATMKGYRVVGINTGTSKKGVKWASLTVLKDGRTAEVSTTNSELMDTIQDLAELDVVNLDVRAVAGKERSYITLIAPPVFVESAGV